MVSSATRESISLTLQEEMIPVFKELSRDSIVEDKIEIIDDHRSPTAKKNKIHPLRNLLGDNFGGLSSSASDENADNI